MSDSTFFDKIVEVGMVPFTRVMCTCENKWKGEIGLQTLFIGSSACKEAEVRYYLLAEEPETDTGCYGLRVEFGGEAETIHGITASQHVILSLLSALVRGAVTPVAVRDVIEDWLLI